MLTVIDTQCGPGALGNAWVWHLEEGVEELIPTVVPTFALS